MCSLQFEKDIKCPPHNKRPRKVLSIPSYPRLLSKIWLKVFLRSSSNYIFWHYSIIIKSSCLHRETNSVYSSVFHLNPFKTFSCIYAMWMWMNSSSASVWKLIEDIHRCFIYSKASDEAILQNICSWGYGLLVNHMYSYKISRKLSWEIWSVLMVLLSPGKSYTCSCRILRKLSWKFWCVLIPFLVLLENLMCSYKRIMFSPWKFKVF